MKNIYKTFLIVLVAFGITSCEDSDLQIDSLYDNVDTTGSVLRILEYPTDIINMSGGELTHNALEYTFEVQEGDGSFMPDFKEVRYFLTPYNDQDLEFPSKNADGSVIGEIFYKTIDASEFDELSTINGLPMNSQSTPTRFLLDEFWPSAVFGSANPFIISRFELEMTDGRVWTDTNAGATLSGPYFESPFFYKTIWKLDEGIQTDLKVNSDEPEEGDELKFTIKVKNVGDEDFDGSFSVTNITLNTGLLPEGLTYDHDDSNGTYDPATGIWTIGDIAPGDNIKLKLYAIVNSGTTGTDITYSINEAIGDQRNPVVDQSKLTVVMAVE